MNHEMKLATAVWVTLLEYSEWLSTGAPGTLVLSVPYGTTIDMEFEYHEYSSTRGQSDLKLPLFAFFDSSSAT